MSGRQTLIGFHAVIARLRSHAASIRDIYVDATRRDARTRDLLAAAKGKGVPVHEVAGERLDGIAAGVRHQGVIALAEQLQLAHDIDSVLDPLTVPPLLMILDGITDPHNLGACLRVADAAGVHAVIAPRDRAVGLTPVVAKVASGAAETVPYITVTNLARTLAELKERGIWIVGSDDGAPASLFESDLKMPLAWVMGAEGQGMRRLTREACDVLLRIPMAGSIESLNVSVAAGICLFETVRQRGARA